MFSTKLIAVLALLVMLVASLVGIYAYGYKAGQTAARASQIASTETLNARVVTWATTRAEALAAQSSARRAQAAAAATGKLVAGGYDYSPAERARLTAITLGARNAH
jgi:hypothetical protein